jgi:hypothetical protein
VVVAGVYARLTDKRYDVAVAVASDTSLLDHTHVSAAPSEAVSGQLRDLYVRAHEVLRPHSVEIVVLWPPDPPPGGRIRLIPTLATGRAEGAALAAAGELGIRSDVITGAGVRAAGGGSTDEATDALCTPIHGVPGDEAVRRAVAAARAWGARNS